MLRDMADCLSDRYADLLTGSYDCVDRIVLKPISGWGMMPGASVCGGVN
jgi:hypothetical protein